MTKIIDISTKKAVLITAFFFLLLMVIGQRYQENSSINSNKIFENKIDSLSKISSLLEKQFLWDSFYICQREIFMLGKKNAKLGNVRDLILANLDKIPANKSKLKAKGYYLSSLLEDALGNVYNTPNKIEKIISSFPMHKDTYLLLSSYNFLGIFQTKTRNYNEAISYLQKSNELAKTIRDTQSIVNSLNNISRAFLWQGDYSLARKYIIESNLLQKDETGKKGIIISQSYLFEGNLEEALIKGTSAFNKSVESKAEDMQFYGLTNLASIYAKKKDFIQAHKMFTQALQLRHKIQDKREIVKTLVPFAKTKRNLNKIDEAIQLLDESIELIGYDRKVINGKTLPVEMNLIEIFEEKADCYLAKYENDVNAVHLQSASYYFDKCIEVMTDMRNFHDNPGTIEEISKNGKEIFEKNLATSIKLYEISKDKKYLDKVFIYIQKYGSFNLRKNVSERKALDIAIEDEYTRNKFLKAKNVFLNEEYKLNSEYDDDVFESYNNAKNYFLKLRDSLEKHNHKFNKLSQKITYVSIKDIQKKLQSSEVFVQYFYCPEKLYTINVYKNEVTYSIIDNGEALKNNVQDFITLLHDPTYGEKGYNQDSLQNKFQALSYDLYGKLVAESIKNRNLTKLIIVPDGALFRIPFESLTVSPNAKWNLASSFLLSKYTIDYLYYAAQYLKDEVKEYQDYFVGFGLEYDKYTLESMMEGKKDTTVYWIKDKFRSKSLSHLYFADDEVKAIEKHFDGKTFLNQNATKINLTTNMHKAGILHISAHSCVDYADPQKSAIILHKNDSITDNLLKYDDITACDLNSQMVILSACSSASGKISEAEGMSSLSKAFFEAGSQSVVGSYWSVPDEISKIFMEAFYEKLKSGKPKDVALRETKLEFMTTNSLVNPYYKRPQFWAAWTLYGDVQPLKVNHFKYWWIALSALALSLITFFFWKKRSRSMA